MKRKKDVSLETALSVAKAADKLKAIDLKVLDLRKLQTFADFFVIAGGTSDRHVEAIADSIVREMKKKGRIPFGVEGYEHSQWVLVDFGDVVAHIFYGALREIYAIEKLWADAKQIKIK